jgi:hypothetical protein
MEAARALLIAVVIPHLLAKVDPVDTGGNDLRELVRLEKRRVLSSSREHYVTYGAGLPRRPTEVDVDDIRLQPCDPSHPVQCW